MTDFFVVARRSDARFYDFTSLHPTRKLVRTIALEGGRAVRMRMAVQARPDYARRQPAWQVVKGGYSMVDVSLFTSVPLTVEESDLVAEFSLESGSRHFAVLDYSDERTAPDFAAIDRWQEITEASGTSGTCSTITADRIRRSLGAAPSR
ncbi:MAG: hypothetical protein H0X34_03990 [Chthoniobacterales bacterium]|nr:hypothetical protein [Chthoniobacterales bacterium]